MTSTASVADTRADQVVGSRARRGVRVVGAFGVLLVVFGIATVVGAHIADTVTSSHALDFDINLVAANRLVGGRDVYDAAASHAEALRRLGPSMRDSFVDPFSSFVGLPAVAVLHLPFVAMSHEAGVDALRVLSVVGMVGGVALAAGALPRGNRLAAFVVGIGAALLSYPAVNMLSLGQLDTVTLLGLALGVWGIARDRPNVSGVGLAVGAVLKLTPAVLLAYLLLRGERRVGKPAVLTAGVMVVGSMLVGQPGAVITWITDIAPSISRSTRFGGNQSLVAWVDRLIGPSPDFVHRDLPMGGVRYLGVVIVVVAVVGMLKLCRGAVAPLEIGALILVTLLAGPLSWDHYYVWTLVPIVLLCDVRYWLWFTVPLRVALGAASLAAVGALTVPIYGYRPSVVAEQWLYRVTTSPYPFAALVLLVVSLAFLARGAAISAEVKEGAPEHQHQRNIAAPDLVGVR